MELECPPWVDSGRWDLGISGLVRGRLLKLPAMRVPATPLWHPLTPFDLRTFESHSLRLGIPTSRGDVSLLACLSLDFAAFANRRST